MREHKFRIWFYDGEDLKTGEMVSLETAFRENYLEASYLDLQPTDKCTIMLEWTGLEDSKGVGIFEGDVVYFSYGIPGRRVDAEVRFEGGAFYAMTPKESLKRCLLAELEEHVGEIEIIGNIYSNPELLKKER